MLNFIVNQQEIRSDEHPGMVLLEFLREVTCLSGTKEACREGECGACTVLVGSPQADGTLAYKACASCLLPIGDVDGCHVVTVEGLSGAKLNLVQQLIVDFDASQCGFCTPGIVLSLTGFALTSRAFEYGDAVDALDGNLCRCTGYVAIRNAARALTETLSKLDRRPGSRVATLVDAGVLPAWFPTIPQRLAKLPTLPQVPNRKAVLVAGGTDLFVQRPEALLEADLCFLSRRRDLDYIRADQQFLRIGGAVTLEDLRRSDLAHQHFPSLRQDLLLHSSTILRNKATITGNLVNASPIGDATIILLALDARLVLTDTAGATRQTPLDRFFLGYKKCDLACGELITEILIPLPGPGTRFNFEKVSNRVILDIAAVNSALRVTTAPDGTIQDLRISAGGVGPVPLLVPGLEAFCGRLPDAPTVNAIADAVADAAKPIDDIRGSAAYKGLLIRQLALAHFAAPEAAEVTP